MATFIENATEELFTVSPGDLTDFIYARPSVLAGGAIDANWSCTQRLERNGSTVIDSVAVTEKSGDSTEFKVYLTGVQTADLEGNGNRHIEYDWVITLSNSTLTPVQTRTLRLRLGVA